MDDEPTGHDQGPDAVPPHRRSARNPGARAVVVVLGIIALVLGGWWVLDVLL